MLAAVYREHGRGDEVLSVENLALPEPGTGEVRVHIRCSAVNPTDWKQRNGNGERRPVSGFPFIVPNQDGAGDIDAVGAGVDSRRIGERVWIYFCSYRRQFGTAEEYVCLPAEQAVELPGGISYELGASLGIPALTRRIVACSPTVHSLVGRCSSREERVRSGTSPLSSDDGTGREWLPPRATTKRPPSLGVREPNWSVDYKDAGAAAEIMKFAPKGIDRIVEVALGVNLALDSAVLAPGGAVSTYATDAVTPAIDVGVFMRRNNVLRFVLVYTMGTEAVGRAVGDVTAALRAGALSELPAHHFPLSDIAAAHHAVEEGATGKVFVDI